MSTELSDLTVDFTSPNVIFVEPKTPLTRWDDATWILTSAFIIFTMQSGFGLLESGSVSQKNEVHIMVKNAVDVMFGGLSYWMFGYGLSFGKGESFIPWFSGTGDFFVNTPMNDTGDGIGKLYSHFVFHASFATTATTIVSGAMVERTKLESYIIFSFANTLVYCFPAHWVWDGAGWLKKLGVVDVAGAGSVHLVGGVTGLVATIMLKPRYGRFKEGAKVSAMSSPTNAIFGMFMLWWGWLGFNCGSTYGITDTKWILAARSATSTITASIGGGITGIILSYLMNKRKFDVVFLINGVLGSLVAITAICALARPWQGVLIGAVGALIACLGGPLCEKLKIDDPVGVVPVHGMSSIWGLIAVGIFGENDELSGDFIHHDGLIAGGFGGFRLLGIQVLAVVSISAWTAVTAFITLKVLDITIGLRVPLHEEILGADLVEHSLNGTYDKITSEWWDREGHLIMVVKQHKNNPEYLEHMMSKSASCPSCEFTNPNEPQRRRSAFGFSRSDDTMSNASEMVSSMNIIEDVGSSPDSPSVRGRRSTVSQNNSVGTFAKLRRTISGGLKRRSETYSLDSNQQESQDGTICMTHANI